MIGPRRKPGSREGLTRKGAEAELQRQMHATRVSPRVGSGITFEAAAAEYLRYAEVVRKLDSKTLTDHRGVIEGYLLDEFGTIALGAVTPD